jgi:hypothetical protein
MKESTEKNKEPSSNKSKVEPMSGTKIKGIKEIGPKGSKEKRSSREGSGGKS